MDVPAALIAARAVHFAAIAIMLGGGGLALLVRAGDTGATLRRGAALAAMASGLAWLAATVLGITDAAADLLRPDIWLAFLAQPPFGPAWAVRLVLLAACVAILPVRRPAPYSVVGLLLVLDQAWLGHAATGAGWVGTAMVAIYWVHALAGLAWVGALIALLALLRAPHRLGRDRREVEAALALFSTSGIALVAAIVASGAANASFHLDDPRQLATTSYGRLILAKAALLLAMVVLALFNRRNARRGGSRLRPLAVSIGVETCLGMVVLAIAAALGVTAPP